jgi:putative MATE family efflux protein
MTNDMTTGSPAKLIIRFMIPTCLGNIFQQFYNLADSVIAGRFIGMEALAAIGSTTSLIFLVIGWLNGLTSGFAILVAQQFGAKKFSRMRHYVAMSIFLCLAFVVVMTGTLGVLNYPILRRMNTPAEIIGDTGSYMSVIYAGLITTASYNALAAVLRALGDGRSPLYFLIISGVINVVLDIVFIVKLHMAVVGCAYATVIAQGISALLCLLYIIRKFDILRLKKEDFKLSLRTMGKLLNMGIPMGLQFSITAIGTIIVQGAINSFGSVYIAGYAAGGKVQSVVSCVFVSFGATVASYVGQNRGAGRIDRVRQGVKITQVMILVWSVVMMLFIHFLGNNLIGIFVGQGEEEVIAAARTYFRAVSWCYPFLGSIFLYRNALQGLGYGFVPMMGGIFELAARAAIVWAVTGFAGYLGVCLADPAAWIAALIPLVPYYYYKISKEG